jgi:hypothetical protein
MAWVRLASIAREAEITICAVHYGAHLSPWFLRQSQKIKKASYSTGFLREISIYPNHAEPSR